MMHKATRRSEKSSTENIKVICIFTFKPFGATEGFLSFFFFFREDTPQFLQFIISFYSFKIIFNEPPPSSTCIRCTCIADDDLRNFKLKHREIFWILIADHEVAALVRLVGPFCLLNCWLSYWLKSTLLLQTYQNIKIITQSVKSKHIYTKYSG